MWKQFEKLENFINYFLIGTKYILQYFCSYVIENIIILYYIIVYTF